jgi:hypothetical protein
MTMKLLTLATGVIGALVATGASAQSSDSQEFQVTGNVPGLCSVGNLGNEGGVFAMGTLIDTSTGLLRDDLSAPAKSLTGAFCSARSTITVDATRMEAQNNNSAPSGFSRAVDFVATASGWTETAASYDTAAATNPNAVQTRTTAFQGDITVSVDNFSTVGGGNLLLVADPSYLGSVIVTLAAAD